MKFTVDLQQLHIHIIFCLTCADVPLTAAAAAACFLRSSSSRDVCSRRASSIVSANCWLVKLSADVRRTSPLRHSSSRCWMKNDCNSTESSYTCQSHTYTCQSWHTHLSIITLTCQSHTHIHLSIITHSRLDHTHTPINHDTHLSITHTPVNHPTPVLLQQFPKSLPLGPGLTGSNSRETGSLKQKTESMITWLMSQLFYFNFFTFFYKGGLVNYPFTHWKDLSLKWAKMC